MISTIAEHRDEIEALSQRFHVRRLDLFGSAARGDDFTDTSDIDFLVEFEPAHAPPSLGEFFALREALAALLGRKIDLTIAGAIRNPFLHAAIERSRVTLHGA